jgi:predicted HicB family RNase H-like nuclease
MDARMSEEPNKNAKKNKRATLRLPEPLKAEYQQMAIEDNRSFNEMVELALKMARPHLKQRIALVKSGFLMPAVA